MRFMAKHHLHQASFFASIFHLVNIRRFPFSLSPSHSSSISISNCCHDNDVSESFHRTLAHRLAHLLPSEAAALANTASLRRLLGLLLDTEWDLRKLQSDPNHGHPLSHCQETTTSGFFFDGCIKLLDACNVIRELVWEVQQWSKLLRLALGSLDQGGSASLCRARKALVEVMRLMDLDRNVMTKKKKKTTMAMEESARPSLLQNRNRKHASKAVAELHAMCSSLSVQRHGYCSEESSTAAAFYALSFVSAFFLTTVLTVLRAPFGGGPTVINSQPLPNFPWSAPLTAMQGKVAKEAKTRRRGRKGGNKMLSELDCIAINVRDLYRAITKNGDDGDHQIPSRREEICRMVKRLQWCVEELEKDLGPLDAQVTELYKCLLEMRTRSLDLQSPGRCDSDS